MKPLRFMLILKGILLLTGLTGCVPSISVQPLKSTEIEKVKEHQLAVVLFQLQASIDGKPVSPLGLNDPNNSYRIYLANLNEFGAPAQVHPVSPSEEAANKGWRYLMLPPGVYYMLVLPPGVEQNPPAVAYHADSARYGRLTHYKFEPGRGGFWSDELVGFVLTGTQPEDFQELAGYWFQVHENKQIIYLGSISTECRGGRGLFGGLIDSCSEYEFANDQQSAKQVVTSTLPGLALDYFPLVPFGKPTGKARFFEIGEMKVVARPPSMLSATFTGAEMAPWGVIHGTGQSIAIFNLLAIGFELGKRASAENRAANLLVESQHCTDRLSNAGSAIDYSSRFLFALGQAAHDRGNVIELSSAGQTAEGVESRISHYSLITNMPILRLREVGKTQHLALELALEVRIEEAETKNLIYYNILHYAPELPMQNPLAPGSSLYTTFLSQEAKPRPIVEWCGNGGIVILEEEIAAALNQMAMQVVRDLDSSR